MITSPTIHDCAGATLTHRGVQLTALRDIHFMDVCRRLLADPRCKFKSARELTAVAAARPAPLFYVSFAHALRVLRTYYTTGRLPCRDREAGERWVEIVDRVERIRYRHGVSDVEALTRVLEGSAPCFYIRPSTALRLFHRIRHNRRRKPTETV